MVCKLILCQNIRKNESIPNLALVNEFFFYKTNVNFDFNKIILLHFFNELRLSINVSAFCSAFSLLKDDNLVFQLIIFLQNYKFLS